MLSRAFPAGTTRFRFHAAIRVANLPASRVKSSTTLKRGFREDVENAEFRRAVEIGELVVMGVVIGESVCTVDAFKLE
jgi:hypothetical protein